MAPPRENIDLLESDGSSEDSYHSSQDSAGSLREFVVEDDAMDELSDYGTDSDATTCTLSDPEEDERPAPRAKRPRRAVRDRAPRYVLDLEQQDDSDEEYTPVCTVLEFEIDQRAMGQLHTGVQRFLAE